MQRILFAFLIAISANFAYANTPNSAGGPGAQKKSSDPQRIIEQLRGDFDRAGSDLEQRKIDQATQETQQRIVDGIDELLKQRERSPSSKSNSSPPKSKAAVPPPMPEPAPANKKTVEKASEPAAKKAALAGKPRVEPAPASSDRWGLPPRHRDAIDAVSGDRLVPRYEELLRAYYRALSEAKP